MRTRTWFSSDTFRMSDAGRRACRVGKIASHWDATRDFAGDFAHPTLRRTTASQLGQHQALECNGIIEHQADRQGPSAPRQLLQLVPAGEASVVLLGGHQLEPVVIGESTKRLGLCLGIGVMIGKPAAMSKSSEGGVTVCSSFPLLQR